SPSLYTHGAFKDTLDPPYHSRVPDHIKRHFHDFRLSPEVHEFEGGKRSFPVCPKCNISPFFSSEHSAMSGVFL
ncbi:hypothetical protein TNCV_3560581, partial [Trichonephila clavipes]